MPEVANKQSHLRIVPRKKGHGESSISSFYCFKQLSFKECFLPQFKPSIFCLITGKKQKRLYGDSLCCYVVRK